jgi:hypothetical protein
VKYRCLSFSLAAVASLFCRLEQIGYLGSVIFH